MDVSESIIIQIAQEEIETRSFGTTEQFLEVHQVGFKNGKPIVAHISYARKDGIVMVYFPVINEMFYLAIGISIAPTVSVVCVYTEPYHSIYFKAFSNQHSLGELLKMTKLACTNCHNKGDKRGNTGTWKNSIILIEPNLEPDNFEVKLDSFLNYIEGDKIGIQKLRREANGYIQIYSCFHNGNRMIGGHNLRSEFLRRISNLQLDIDFDIKVSGNFFKD